MVCIFDDTLLHTIFVFHTTNFSFFFFLSLPTAGQWEAALDMLTWMDREIPPAKKSITTYQTVRTVVSTDNGRMEGKKG